MDRHVTLEDVAKLAGVNKATASRALNPTSRSLVNNHTALRVTEAAKTLGYVRNLTARSLRVKTTMTVGVIIPDLTNPIFPPMVRGIENYLSLHGYTVLMADTDESAEAEDKAITSLIERRVDGLIVATGTDDREAIPRLFSLGMPVVLANRGAGKVQYPLVIGDDTAGIFAAVTHLKDLGHRKIVHITGPQNFSTTQNRARAFTQACLEMKLNGRIIVATGLRAEGGETVMDGELEKGRDFTAVVATTDLLALGALRSLRRHNLNCPKEVSVVGFNDMPFADEFSPGLTTVRVPLNQIGEEAARLLVRRLGGEEVSAQAVTLPVTLVVRKSTDVVQPIRG
jgi:LacI family transcriptional regulator